MNTWFLLSLLLSSMVTGQEIQYNKEGEWCNYILPDGPLCQEGLSCFLKGSMLGTCVKPVGRGEHCNFERGIICDSGLECLPKPKIMALHIMWFFHVCA